MFTENRASNGILYVTSDIIKSKHAFSTRIGGVSKLRHTSSLNLAFNRGDEKEIVLENLRLFGEAVGFEPQCVISLPQIHSDSIITVDKAMGGEGYFKAPHTSCDGYITEESGVVLGVKTADCVPIIMEVTEENGDVAAVAALHAGWRGTVAGIAERAVQMFSDRGFSVNNIRAAIGPSIGSCCFEVGEDFLQTVKNLRGEDFAKKFIAESNKRLYADIKAMNFEILENMGVLRENIDVSTQCTYCCSEKYYSHRRMAGERGTMLSVIFM